MAITAANLTFGNTTSAASSATTASISPTANNLVIVSATGSTAKVPTVTGAGGIWTFVASKFDAGGIRGVHMFRDLSAAPGSGTLAIDFGGVSQNFIGWSVDQFSGIDASGPHGSTAIVQNAGATSSATTTGITVTLASLATAGSAAYGFIRNNASNTIIKGASFTELSNSVTGQIEAEYAINQTAVGWTWASQTVTTVALAIEIRVPGVAPSWVQGPASIMPESDWL